jgi:glycosyltransferase involved in cell wall biosynthesis
MPKISMVLTSFNHEKYIREATDSVLNQGFTDFELKIWDDASADRSWEVINSYLDPSIKVFHNDVSKRLLYQKAYNDQAHLPLRSAAEKRSGVVPCSASSVLEH